MVTKVLKINNMHCTSCALAIEFALEDIGVKAHGSYAKGEVEVEYDAKKNTEKEIIATINKTGYTVLP